MKKVIFILIAILIGCNVDCLAQGKVTRPSKQQSQTGKQQSQANKQKKSNSEVKVSKPDGYDNGHGYVDLGLSVKWATCNIGGNAAEEYGDYFAWGEISSKSSYTDKNSQTYGKSVSDMQKKGIINSQGVLNKKYDAASANWGGSWRMPTNSDFEELIKKCKWEWTSINGIRGYKVIGLNGKTIFLPAAGMRYSTSYDYVGYFGFYWDSTVYEGLYYANYLYFEDGTYKIDWRTRNGGRSVRAVSE